MEQRTYYGRIDPNALADHLVGVFNQHPGQGMYYSHNHTMAQRVGEGDQVLVQIVRAGSWGQNGGTLGVSIVRVPDGISVNLGQSNWLDLDQSTVAGMVIGALLFPPLLLLPLLSGLVGSTFNQDIWDVIDGYCSWVNASGPEKAQAPRYFHCPYCGAYNQPNVPQCVSCKGTFYTTPAEPPQYVTPTPRKAAPAQPTGEPLKPATQSEPEPVIITPEPEPEVADVPGSESVVCPACGVTVAAANFCGHCAAPLR